MYCTYHAFSGYIVYSILIMSLLISTQTQSKSLESLLYICLQEGNKKSGRCRVQGRDISNASRRVFLTTATDDYTMDDREEDHPRISVESIQAWNTVRSNCTTALLAQVDAQLEEMSISQSERDALIAHVQQVSITVWITFLRSS